MNRLFAAIAIIGTLALGACGGATFGTLTKTVSNPVSSVDIYRVKNVYAASLVLANKYRSFCWSKPYAALMADPIAKPTCQNRRAIVRGLQAADTKANAAIGTADRFVKANPTLNAATAIGAAWKSVTDFQSLATSATAKVRI